MAHDNESLFKKRKCPCLTFGFDFTVSEEACSAGVPDELKKQRKCSGSRESFRLCDRHTDRDSLW